MEIRAFKTHKAWLYIYLVATPEIVSDVLRLMSVGCRLPAIMCSVRVRMFGWSTLCTSTNADSSTFASGLRMYATWAALAAACENRINEMLQDYGQLRAASECQAK